MRREALRAETFKVGHHGQANALDEELLGAVAPKYAIISASSNRRYESAAPGVLSMLHAYGTKTYFTDVRRAHAACGGGFCGRAGWEHVGALSVEMTADLKRNASRLCRKKEK